MAQTLKRQNAALQPKPICLNLQIIHAIVDCPAGCPKWTCTRKVSAMLQGSQLKTACLSHAWQQDEANNRVATSLVCHSQMDFHLLTCNV